MTGFGIMAWVILTFAMIAPKSFGRHLAEIADTYAVKRVQLRAEREAKP